MNPQKMCVVLLTLLCGLNIGAPVNAFAINSSDELTGVEQVAEIVSATYDSCDVNHDGVVNMEDVVTINQYLSGYKYYTNYNQLDANKSHTIDGADSICVMNAAIGSTYSACYIRQYPNAYMQPVTMPAVSSTVTLDASVNQTNDRWYVGYSYTQNKAISRYKLTAPAATVNGASYETYGLINGDDNRGVAHGYENTGIVAIGDNATGFIVGDHQIATAAHCVHTDGKIRTDVKVWTYDRSGAPTGDSLTVAERHVPEDYVSGGTKHDYALITVKEDLSEYVHFQIGNCYNMTSSEVGAIPIHVTGQPDQVVNPDTGKLETQWDNLLYTHNGSVYGNNNTEFLHYTVDTTSGQSGSPVYAIIRERYNNEVYYRYIALAIHTWSGGSVYNEGPLMMKYQIQFYNNNSHANYQ